MENFKFIITSIIFLALVAFAGYWAFFTIEPGDAHVSKQKQQQLEERNEELEKEVAKLKSELAMFETETPEPVVEQPTTTPTPTTPQPTTTNSKHQTLVNELQKLIDDNVYMKQGSRGTRVGTVQNFLNVYNGTTKRIDNDYGAGMKQDVINFQKKEGLTADGEAGPTTFKKMIEWLKKQ